MTEKEWFERTNINHSYKIKEICWKGGYTIVEDEDGNLFKVTAVIKDNKFTGMMRVESV